MAGSRSLASFLATFEAPRFSAGKVKPIPELESGVLTFPQVELCEPVSQFVSTAYESGWVLSDFNWSDWSQTAEAKQLCSEDCKINQTTELQISKLLTMIIRQDRFGEGAILRALESGLALKIVRRAAAAPLA